MELFFNDAYRTHQPSVIQKMYRRLVSNLKDFCSFVEPLEDVALVEWHDKDYVHSIRDEYPKAPRQNVTLPWNLLLYEEHYYYVASMIAAAKTAYISGDTSVVLADNSNEAVYETGYRRSVFNSMAIAARIFGRDAKIAIVDFAAEQAYGTSRMCDADIFDFWAVSHAEPRTDHYYGVCVKDEKSDNFLERVNIVAQKLRNYDFVLWNASLSGMMHLSDFDNPTKIVNRKRVSDRDEIVKSACYKYGVPFVYMVGSGYDDAQFRTSATMFSQLIRALP